MGTSRAVRRTVVLGALTLLAGQAALVGQGDSPAAQQALRAAEAAYYGYTVSRAEVALLFEEAAAKGSVEGKAALARIYFFGRGVAQNKARAADFARTVLPELERRAAAGSASAQYYLGELYSNGIGVTQDLVKAFSLYQRAAGAGLAWAQSSLADAYMWGEGTAKDPGQAIVWVQRSTAQGYAHAEYQTGLWHLYGNGFPPSTEAGVRWLTRAADRGHAGARTDLGMLYLSGARVAKDLALAERFLAPAADDDLAEAQAGLAEIRHGQRKYEESLRLFRSASAKGDNWARVRLGEILWAGQGVEADQEAACRYFDQAFSGGFEKVAFNLGVCRERGAGGPRDPVAAAGFYRKYLSLDDQDAPQAGDAALNLGHIVENSNPREAFEMFQRASGAPIGMRAAHAKYHVAIYLEQGKVVPRDVARSLAILQEAVDAGETDAMVEMAERHLAGRVGGVVDRAKAMALLQRAAAAGHGRAQNVLDAMRARGELPNR